MKELNDIDFDQIFKVRIAEELPDFEEESWLKMEQKLRKKDRFLVYRNASAVLLFLSFGLGFYYLNKSTPIQQGQIVALENKIKKTSNKNHGTIRVLKDLNGIVSAHQVINNSEAKTAKKERIKTVHQQFEGIEKSKSPSILTDFSTLQNVKNELKKVLDQTPVQLIAEIIPTVQPEANTLSEAVLQAQNIDQSIPDVTPAAELTSDGSEKKVVTARVKKKIPISLAISAGPDFNSASSLIGGKTSIAFGLSVGFGLTKRLSLQTGVGFGMKNYSGDAATYSFAGAKQTATPYNPYAPVAQTTITGINAACKVLEVPLLASFELSNNQKRSISFNAGLSSYFMLKEEYVYKYTEASGKKDRINEFTNANQHILSVVNLSATYNLKLKNKKFGFGIEPYIKIPLTGIGEGSVPLKSSGISLKLQYDVNKK